MSIKTVAQQVAILQAVRDAIAHDLQRRRAKLLDGLLASREEYGVKSMEIKLPDGTKVATAILVDKNGQIVVTNPTAFAAWVQARWPDQIELRVRPAFAETLLARFAADNGGDVADTATGELVDGVTAIHATIPTQFQLRYATGGRDAIAEAWRAGELEGLVGTPAPKALENPGASDD